MIYDSSDVALQDTVFEYLNPYFLQGYTVVVSMWQYGYANRIQRSVAKVGKNNPSK